MLVAGRDVADVPLVKYNMLLPTDPTLGKPSSGCSMEAESVSRLLAKRYVMCRMWSYANVLKQDELMLLRIEASSLKNDGPRQNYGPAGEVARHATAKAMKDCRDGTVQRGSNEM